MGALLPDRILWGTDSVWYGPPQSLIDAFRRFTIPDSMRERFGYPPLTPATKDAILGANAEALYGITRPAAPTEREWLEAARRELAERLA